MTPDASDLSWLAFQYVAGELDAAEAGAFELRLADDQEAREAVAGAVGLAQTLRTAGRSEAAAERPRALMSPSRRWTAVAAAACLSAVAVGAWRANPVPSAPSPASNVNDPVAASRAVALNWSGLEGPDELLAWLDEPSSPVEVDPETDEYGPPAWLVEAAALGEAPEAERPGS